MTYSQEKSQSTGTDPDLIQMLGLTNKGLKTVMIIMNEKTVDLKSKNKL